MDARLNDDEALFEETVDALLAKAVPATVHDLLELDERPLWSAMAGAGLLGLGLPEAAGGAGSALDTTLAVEASGRALSPAPLLGVTVLGAQLLVAAGAPPEVVAPVVAGQLRVAVALEPGLDRLAWEDEPAAVTWDAAGASAALVRARSGLAAVAVGPPRRGLDQTRTVADADLGAAVELGDLGGPLSPEALERWYARAWTMLAADAVGVMDGALRLAVAHAKSREQFGVPIGSFQAVQHLLAGAHASLRGARSVTRFAAWALDHREADEAVRAARVAKAYTAGAGRAVCEVAVQVHGGMGMTWDSPAHLYLRRAIADARLLGDEQSHLLALAGD